MIENSKINYKQIICIIFISRIILTLTYLPALTSPPANQDIWICDLIILPAQLIFAIPIYLLWKKFPNQTIIEYSQTIAGITGKLIGALYVLFFIHFTAITLSQFGIFLTTAIMPETPKLFFAISIILFCSYAVKKGIEVLGRLGEIVSLLLIIAIISIVLLLVKDMNLKYLAPVLEKGILPVIHGGVTPSARTVEILGLAMILPYLNNPKKAKSVLILGFTLMIVFFLLIDIPTMTSLGIEVAKSQSFPFYSAVGLISVGDFLERIEAFHIGIWVLGVFIKISFYYYLSVIGISQLFKLKDYKPLVIPTGTIIIPLSIIIAPSIVELREFTSYKIFTWYAGAFIILFPLILLTISIVRKKGVPLK